MKKVVVTGIGVISPIGIGLDDYWAALAAGASGCNISQVLSDKGNRSNLACEADAFSPESYMDKKLIKRTSRFIQFALTSAQLALEQAKGFETAYSSHQVGTLIGVGAGGYDALDTEYDKYFKKGPRYASPFAITNTIPNMAASNVAIANNFTGLCVAPVAACAAGLYAVCEAVSFIQSGLIDAAIAGGVESTMTSFVVGGYDRLRVLSTRNDTPETASRPFDRDRDGFVIAEGCALFALESYDSALQRGANILGEISGFSLSCDASHITSPDLSGNVMAATMKQAIHSASIGTSDIAYVNAHGTSTKVNDLVEAKAINDVFGDLESPMVVTAIKSMIGHSLGASGALALAASLQSLNKNIIPPTINTSNLDEECRITIAGNRAKHKICNHVLTNAFGFGGHNASVVTSRI
ncbi:3-oxoacyl-[acyl-carrier-protein] synthase, KASII [hydrothermal vent metagenome]|uniref:3-oxoacyl-[acyl-carrier-protein] synthase, KASII n=1 Tax=hydrothermal vent metagenome TaxID=652676 RepID=A0A3B1BAE4_9ZZZZ